MWLFHSVAADIEFIPGNSIRPMKSLPHEKKIKLCSKIVTSPERYALFLFMYFTFSRINVTIMFYIHRCLFSYCSICIGNISLKELTAQKNISPPLAGHMHITPVPERYLRPLYERTLRGGEE